MPIDSTCRVRPFFWFYVDRSTNYTLIPFHGLCHPAKVTVSRPLFFIGPKKGGLRHSKFLKTNLVLEGILAKPGVNTSLVLPWNLCTNVHTTNYLQRLAIEQIRVTVSATILQISYRKFICNVIHLCRFGSTGKTYVTLIIP
jgi:hypothetical protein